MANSASHTASSAERRGQKLATLFLRAKKSYGRLAARSTSWTLSRGWPAWIGKVPLITFGILLLAVSLFSILALAAVAILGIALLLLARFAHKSDLSSSLKYTVSKNKDDDFGYSFKNGYYDE